MEHVNKPNFNNYISASDIEQIKSHANYSFNQLKNMKSQMISALRQLSTLKSYEDRKSEQVDRFQQKADDTKSSKETWVSNKTGQILDLETTVRGTFLEIKQLKAITERRLATAMLRNEISNKDKNAVEMYLNFMSDIESFFESNKGAFEDGRLAQLAQDYDGYEEEWEGFVSIIESKYFILFQDQKALFDLKNETIEQTKEFSNYYESMNFLLDNYSARLNAVVNAKGSATGLDLIELETLEAELIAKIDEANAEKQDAQNQFNQWFQWRESFQDERDWAQYSLKTGLDAYISDTTDNISDEWLKDAQGKHKNLEIAKFIVAGAQNAGMSDANHLNDYLTTRGALLEDKYSTTNAKETFNNFDSNGLPTGLQGFGLVTEFGSLAELDGVIKGKTDALVFLIQELPNMFNMYASICNTYADLAQEAVFKQGLVDELNQFRNDKYAELANYDLSQAVGNMGTYHAMVSDILSQIGSAEYDLYQHRSSVYKWNNQLQYVYNTRKAKIKDVVNAIITGINSIESEIISLTGAWYAEEYAYFENIEQKRDQVSSLYFKGEAKSDTLSMWKQLKLEMAQHYAYMPIDGKPSNSWLQWPSMIQNIDI